MAPRIAICRACALWDPLGTHRGACRAHPPTQLHAHEGEPGWPQTLADDWCGEWRRAPAQPGLTPAAGSATMSGRPGEPTQHGYLAGAPVTPAPNEGWP